MTPKEKMAQLETKLAEAERIYSDELTAGGYSIEGYRMRDRRAIVQNLRADLVKARCEWLAGVLHAHAKMFPAAGAYQRERLVDFVQEELGLEYRGDADRIVVDLTWRGYAQRVGDDYLVPA